MSKVAMDEGGADSADERPVECGSDDEFFKFAASSGPVAQRMQAAAANVEASEAKLGGTKLGRASHDDVDVEMQPLTAEEGSARVLGAFAKTLKPLYAVWPSRSKFFCRGLLHTGGESECGITPNCSGPNLCAWTCILAPCSLYFTWVLPHLCSMGFYTMPAITIVVFVLVTGFLLASCCSDPGIIPRREVILATNSADLLESTLGYDVLARSSVPLDGSGGGKNLPPELTSRGYRWCRTCRIVRPPRAAHCPDCDNCVMRYDHHCPFVNNCVGQRNYHFFIGFVSTVPCLVILVLPALFWFLNAGSFKKSVQKKASQDLVTPLLYALAVGGVLVGIAALLSILLWMYHMFLIATNRTTKEFVKSIANVDAEPTLFGSRGPQLFDPCALVNPCDLIRQNDTRIPDEDPQFCQCCMNPDN
eukprot:TRINITY_DN19228_c0_g1_i1.p1 TRINITY_DN19228_c0_g1~~TRINITY_DN19228_c0_g1_i1.p1  ORF type:complete len:419 (-),score=51.75 TRINITY_DN19228_c0_g1_i1:101-1357(-)